MRPGLCGEIVQEKGCLMIWEELYFTIRIPQQLKYFFQTNLGWQHRHPGLCAGEITQQGTNSCFKHIHNVQNAEQAPASNLQGGGAQDKIREQNGRILERKKYVLAECGIIYSFYT